MVAAVAECASDINAQQDSSASRYRIRVDDDSVVDVRRDIVAMASDIDRLNGLDWID